MYPGLSGCRRYILFLFASVVRCSGGYMCGVKCRSVVEVEISEGGTPWERPTSSWGGRC